jgi:hypothetical protein
MRSPFTSFRLVSAAVAAAVLMSVVPAFADTLAYADPSGQGTQNWAGNLALTFQVNTTIVVDQLGVFNANGTNALTVPGNITVGIYNSSGVLLTSVVFSSGNTYATSNSDLLQSITPIFLTAGIYQVDAVGFGNSNNNGNLNTGSSAGPTLNDGGGALTFLGAAYDSSTTLDHPTTCVGCQSGPAITQQFDAGTFSFAVAPEPSSFVMLGTGLLSLGTMVRRRFLA